tara:strand:+ start:1000 stop:1518 length:519 start_codon:yes stop_codon:yes gene_type:complete
MTELLGKSVGEWSANEYLNYGGTIGGSSFNRNTDCDGLILSEWTKCGLSLREWSSRASANSTLKGNGLTSVQIARYWKKFQNEVQSSFSKSLFIEYSMSEYKKEYDALEKNKPKNDIITDEVVNTQPPNEEPTENTTSTTSVPTKKSNKNLYIYGGIGLVIIVGAFLIFKNK